MRRPRSCSSLRPRDAGPRTPVNPVLPRRRRTWRPPKGSSGRDAHRRRLRRARHPRQQRRARARRRHRRYGRRRMGGGVRSDAVSRHPRVPPGRAAHAASRRGSHRDDCVHLGPGIGRPHDLQRRQGRRDQPRQVDGAQLARDNIRVNSVAPGSISFPGGTWHRRQQEDPAGMADFVSRELPFGRFGRPEEVGAVVAFLVSPRASWISGASVPVDGCQSRSQI